MAENEIRENIADNVALDTINFHYNEYDNMFIQIINKFIEYYRRDDVDDSQNFAEKLLSSRIRTTTKEELIIELKLTYLIESFCS